jgi:hypothetical protein
MHGMTNMKLTVAEARNHAFGRPDSPVSTNKACDLKMITMAEFCFFNNTKYSDTSANE